MGLGVPALGLAKLDSFLSPTQPQLSVISSMYHLLCSAASLCPFQLLPPHHLVLKGPPTPTLTFSGLEKCVSFLHYQELHLFMA